MGAVPHAWRRSAPPPSSPPPPSQGCSPQPCAPRISSRSSRCPAGRGRSSLACGAGSPPRAPRPAARERCCAPTPRTATGSIPAPAGCRQPGNARSHSLGAVATFPPVPPVRVSHSDRQLSHHAARVIPQRQLRLHRGGEGPEERPCHRVVQWRPRRCQVRPATAPARHDPLAPARHGPLAGVWVSCT